MRRSVRRGRRDISVDGTYDIECAEWDEYVLGVTHHRTRGTIVHPTIDSLVAEMQDAGGTWWSHNGGHYDALAVLDVLRRRNVSMSVSLSGSRVSRVVGGGLVLCDSYSLIPLGLEHAAGLAGLEAPRLDWPCDCPSRGQRPCGGYCSITTTLSRQRWLELADYCVRDAETLMAALDALRIYAAERDYDLQGTVGGSSWSTAQRRLQLRDASHHPALWRRIREGYYGGRVSVLRPSADAGTHWDIVSAYPGALGRTAVPVGDPTEHGSSAATRRLARGQAGIYSATVRVPDMHVPPLPWRYGHDRTAYPIGEVTGTWTETELAAATDDGVTVERVHWAVTWPRTEVIYADLMREWTEERVAQGRHSARGMWLRERQNALAGKLAEGPDKRMVRICPPLSEVRVCELTERCEEECTCGAYVQIDQWGEVYSVPFFRPAPSSHIEQAAYLTAAVRLQVRAALVAHGDDACYTDTDSIWTRRDATPGDRGEHAGQWRQVETWKGLQVAAPKSYAYTHLDGQRELYAVGERVMRTAGARVSRAEWERGIAAQDRGVMSLLSAARSGRGLFTRRRDTWTLPRSGDWYGDRVLAPGAHVTHAVTCEELEKREASERNTRRRR